MTNREMIQLNSALDRVSHIRGKKFAYAVYKNKKLIEEELKIFDKLKRDPHPDYPAYEQERKSLCELHSKKDENGNALKTADGKYDIENTEKFKEEHAVLEEKYKDALEHLNEATKDFEKFLNEEANVELVKVTIEDFPEDIDANILITLKSMIDD